MDRRDIATCLGVLPSEMAFPYFDGREHAWQLARRMPEAAPIAALRQGPLARHLDKAPVREVVAQCGGVLRRADLQPLARAELAPWPKRPAARRALVAACAAPWLDFTLGFGAWGVDWRPHLGQMSRRGGNLVVRLGLPSVLAEAFGRCIGWDRRAGYEIDGHPVQRDGRPTLAWARLDIDMPSGTLLIEEVQSDWLRMARLRGDEIAAGRAAGDLARHRAFEALQERTVGRVWQRVILLAVLVLAEQEFGCTRLWMHRPGPGAVLKTIPARRPPASLYSALPRSFGFVETAAAPWFLLRERKRELSRMARRGPVFWHLDLDTAQAVRSGSARQAA